MTLGQFYPNLNMLDMIPWASFTGIQSAAKPLVTKRIWGERFEDIACFERHLHRNGDGGRFGGGSRHPVEGAGQRGWPALARSG